MKPTTENTGLIVVEPIRQVAGDGQKEKRVVNALYNLYPDWNFYPTPKFFFTDYHITRRAHGGRENYIGDLEIKWLRIPSSKEAIFPFNKLQQTLIAPPYTDAEDIYHRICFRFTDGLLIIPAKVLGFMVPQFHVRWDTKERDLVLYVDAKEYPEYWHDVVITDE